MTIAYLTHEEVSRPSGVTNKITGQITRWEQAGERVILFSLKSSAVACAVPGGEVLTVCTSKKFSDKYLAMFRSVGKLRLKLHRLAPDVIYTRALLYAPGLVRALRKTAPYVVEINSNDATELRTFSRAGHLYNLLTRNLFFKHAAGFVCVSQELSTVDAFAKYRKPTLVIGNGIDTAKYAAIPVTAPADGPCRFVFIGSPGPRWHGIDKIGTLARALPDAHFAVIGLTTDELGRELGGTIPPNVTALGYLDDRASSEVIAASHIGIGTLSLYEKGMEEASALKVRQYLALGIGVILGCRDTDLSGHDLPFILDLPNTPDNIAGSIDTIRDFSRRIRTIDPYTIRTFAATVLDTGVKERQRLEFLHTLAAEGIR